ncbi:MAG TPA: maleylacetate reductase, partial [Terriglobia bacterium]|nr:maleylacetate reductase [Terriglobia bacterium]
MVFGVGTVDHLRDELQRLAVTRPLFIATPGRSQDVERSVTALAGMTAAIHAEAVMHVPVETIASAI